MTPVVHESIPELLRQHPRWLLWDFDGNGKKTPRAASKPSKTINATTASHWTTAAKAAEQSVKHQMGVGFALGSVQDGPSFAGIDLDDCRNPATGAIAPWAQLIIQYVDSYTEVSPSGRGVKIFVLGSLPDGASQGKVYKLEIYDRARYFTVTGQRLPTSRTTVEHREEQLRKLHIHQRSTDLVELAKLFGFYISESRGWVNIHCPWESNHTGSNQERDGGLKIEDGKVVGFNCFHAGCSEKTLGDVRQLFGLRGGNAHDFIVDHHGQVVAQSQENIRRAIDLLGVRLEHDLFSDTRYLVVSEGRRPINDAAVHRLYLNIEETYRFSPPMDYFRMVIQDYARSHPIHPVWTYLNGLKWDEEPRVDTWLVTYGGAVDSPYVRQVGAKTLIAAVRRIRKPGTKHDEMLVLESGQGQLKSSALAALCPNPDWFSDDLPLNLDAKQIIERTLGKWIIEASDLAGMRKSDVEHLKAMLSRSVDGPVRMAYGHFPEERPRSFIIVGTTNSQKYLKDATGNRRFWPVAVKTFNIDALKADRDQLWAEAVVREAQGESNRLDSAYWEAAAQAQVGRQIDDAWLDTLADFLEVAKPERDPAKPPHILDLPHEPKDRVLVSDVWKALGLYSPAQRDERAVIRLEAVMQVLGYVRKQARGPSEERREDGDTGRSAKRWCRVTGED